MPRVYVIVVVPAALPVTNPEDEPIEAMPALAEVHVPPAGDDPAVTERPLHTTLAPVMTPGRGFTVTAAVL